MMAQSNSGSKTFIVAAIDFGTSFSGFAYSTKDDFKENPRKIWTNDPRISGIGNIMSLKEPTCLLLDENKKLVDFGYNAENTYAHIVADGKEQSYYLFKRFKMKLYEAYLFEAANKEFVDLINIVLALEQLFIGLIHNRRVKRQVFSPSMIAIELGGKGMPASEVFALSIKSMVQDLDKKLKKHGKVSDKDKADFGVKDIKWVLTVPAIWSEKAKQFMKKAAIQAGIPGDNLVIALEPECASIFCQYEKLEKKGTDGHGFNVTVPGTKYMVVDLGGGTVDIAVHEKLESGGLRELCHARGGDCGGTSVDDKFLLFMSDLFGKDLITKLRTENPESFMVLTRSFESQKRKFDMSTRDKKISIEIPYQPLNELCQSLYKKSIEAVISESKEMENIALSHGHLRIVGGFFYSFYEDTLEGLRSLLNKTFEDRRVADVRNIVLIGGFAESEIVQQKVKEWFKNKNVMLPEEASIAVLKGAVLFGHRQTYIEERVLQFTYGISVMKAFDQTKHNDDKVVVIDGKKFATNIFHLLVKKDTSVKLGSQILLDISTVKPFQKFVKVVLYLSTSDVIVYTNEEECNEANCVIIEVPVPKRSLQTMTLAFSFSMTEVSVELVKQNQTKEDDTWNFLEWRNFDFKKYEPLI